MVNVLYDGVEAGADDTLPEDRDGVEAEVEGRGGSLCLWDMRFRRMW